jgi:hypothetical protein
MRSGFLCLRGADGFNINIGIRKMPEPDLGLVGGGKQPSTSSDGV